MNRAQDGHQGVLADEARLLALQLLDQDLLPIAVDALRLIAHHPRDYAIPRVAILLDRRLPEETPERARTRIAHRAAFDQIQPPDPD